MKLFFRIPKVQLSIFLILIYFVALISNFSYQLLILLFSVLFSAILSDFIFLKIRKKKLFFPSAAIVTSLIITLIIDPSSPIYFPILASVSAMFSKNFIRIGRHIFNPASLGLGFISVVFAQTVSWWGPSSLYLTDLSALPLFLILLLPFLVSGMRMKRYITIFSFISFYILGSLIFFQSTNNILNLILDPTVIFFSVVMVIEPMTSPSNLKNQLLFGLFIALVAIFSSKLIIQIPFLTTLDPLIFSLLLGNLLFFKNR